MMIRRSVYHGRHRRRTKSNMARFTTASAAAIGFALFAAGPAQAATSTTTLDKIAACESGGNPKASNGSHFGAFQFDMRTWASVGGSGDPRSASLAEQYRLASALLASRGTQPWDASKSCWAGSVAPTLRSSGAAALRAAPKPVAARVKKKEVVSLPARPHPATITRVLPTPVHVTAGTYTVRAGDTLSEIAQAHHMRSWRTLASMNPAVVGDHPDLIFVGDRLVL